MIRFLYPQLLWLLALLPLVALLRGRRGTVAAVKYSSAEIARQVAGETRSRAGRWISTLSLLALGFIIIGLARPQLGRSSSTVEASGVDMILALDCSGSMAALDFKVDGQPTNRLDVVKSVVSKFIDARPNDRIGLIGFAGAPYLVSPLTLDHDWLQRNLERVQIGAVEDGTAIGSALAASVNRLRDQPGKSKVVVLLTDGENNMGKSHLKRQLRPRRRSALRFIPSRPVSGAMRRFQLPMILATSAWSWRRSMSTRRH